MSFIQRLFVGKPLAVRLALATLMLLAIAALSLLLPRAVLTPRGMEMHGMQPAFAATDGYMLLYEFKDYDAATIQPLVEQLTAAVREFKKAHNLPEANPQPGSNDISIGAEALEKCIIKQGTEPPADGSVEEVKKATAIIAVQLTDASLLDELKAELAKIPGLPEPQVTDATWFYEKGLPLPGDDGVKLALNMGQGEHAFNFPKDATPEEMEQAINAWLKETHPDTTFTVQVEKTVEGEQRRIEIRIKGDMDEAAGEAGGHQLDVENAGDEIKLTLKFGDISHTFTFAKSASEQQISEEITAWLAQNYPEHKVKVNVTKTVADGKIQLQVKIEKAEAQDADTSTIK